MCIRDSCTLCYKIPCYQKSFNRSNYIGLLKTENNVCQTNYRFNQFYEFCMPSKVDYTKQKKYCAVSIPQKIQNRSFTKYWFWKLTLYNVFHTILNIHFDRNRHPKKNYVYYQVYSIQQDKHLMSFTVPLRDKSTFRVLI